MPLDTKKSDEIWARYVWLRDNGHREFIEKSDKCEAFWAGDQWKPADIVKLGTRPALTINKILPTIANVLGQQIQNRMEVVFKPRNAEASSQVADTLTKLYMQIADNNMLQWTRSDVFQDGIIGGRGFFDVRMSFDDSVTGEVRIEHLNPRNVLVDADADKADPDTWNDVMTTRWLSADDIELLYGKRDADTIRLNGGSDNPYASAEDEPKDRFGTHRPGQSGTGTYTGDDNVSKMYRVLERQKRELHNTDCFVHIERGDVREVPVSWDNERIAVYLRENPMVRVTRRMLKKIRWTVVAGNVVLHDDWSPYKRFTIVPFFPYFLRGRTVGIVEHLLGPQEYLNKVRSQELHVVNTTANSGWKLKAGTLKNMSVGELEERGAETGLVLELDDINNAEKITPNQVPSGLDRLSFKAEEDIKTISSVSDYMTGQAREDVSAKALQINQQRGTGNFTKVLDNMVRTEWMLARAVLDLVQEYYTEPMIIYITSQQSQMEVQPLEINQVTPAGEIINDLTLGEYTIVVTSQPERDVFEDGQFAQAVSLRQDLGIPIPDEFIIRASQLTNKNEIIQAMKGAQESPEAQQKAQLQEQMEQRAMAAQIAVDEATAAEKAANARLKQIEAQVQAQGGDGVGEVAKAKAEVMKAQNDVQLARERQAAELQLAREKQLGEMALKREVAGQDAQLKQRSAAHERATSYMKMKSDANIQAEKVKLGAKNGPKQPKPKPKR